MQKGVSESMQGIIKIAIGEKNEGVSILKNILGNNLKSIDDDDDDKLENIIDQYSEKNLKILRSKQQIRDIIHTVTLEKDKFDQN